MRLVGRVGGRFVIAPAHMRAFDSFIRVWWRAGTVAGAIGVAFDPVAAPTAAAGAEEPEEAGGPAEGDGEPEEDEDVAAERSVDVVVLQGVVEGPGEGCIEDGNGQGKGKDEDAGYGADDCRRDAPHSREEGGDADENFDGGGDDGDKVGNIHPFRHDTVNFEPIAELFAEEMIGSSLIQSPNIDRIEPKVSLMIATVGDKIGDVVIVARLILEIPLAIIPQAHMIETSNGRVGWGGRRKVHVCGEEGVVGNVDF